MDHRSDLGKKKRRHHQRSKRHEETRYRRAASTAAQTRRDDDGILLPNKYGNEDDEQERGIHHLLGLTLHNPLLHIRSRLLSFSFSSSKPVKMALAIVAVVLLLDYTTSPHGSSVSSSSLTNYFPTLLQHLSSSSITTSGNTNVGNADENGIVGASLPHVTNDGRFHGRYPNSLLTLFYPFTLYRDVVLDQPIDPGDVPFFWHPHVSDEIVIKAVLTNCYNANIIELNTVRDIENAKATNLIQTLVTEGRVGKETVVVQGLYAGQRRNPLIIASPHIREVAELFSQDNFGRTFAFYRHPIDYDVHPELKMSTVVSPTLTRDEEEEVRSNNFLTRLLSNTMDVHTSTKEGHQKQRPLGLKELGTAKQVIRQTTIVGTRDVLSESIFRVGKYHGWVPMGGSGTKESLIDDDSIAKVCIDDVVKDVPGERYADHDSPEWHTFYDANKLDCELYEIARSTWRAQIQTIIPLVLQKRRAGESEDDTEEEE